MKLSSVNNATVKQNNTNNYSKQKNPSFKGATDGIVNFWQFVDNGGRALQFTVEDMLGTNFPRSYKGAMAGYKYTGKINWLALAQEAIREFLTGPTMCVTPVAVLAVAKKVGGKSANTHIENIVNLSNIMQQAGKAAKDGAITENDFFRATVADMLTKSTGEAAKEADVDTMLSALTNYNNLNKALSEGKDLTKAQKKSLKAGIKEAQENLQQAFNGIVKRVKPDYKNTDFTQASYTIKGDKQGATSFKNYIDYTVAYAKDFGKKFSKDNLLNATEENVKNFKKTMSGARLATIAGMIAITGFLMSFVPKIYTLASGNVNPNATAIYNEAEKEEKEVK